MELHKLIWLKSKFLYDLISFQILKGFDEVGTANDGNKKIVNQINIKTFLK